MVKKITLLTAFFCLIYSGLCFAQTENPYSDFNPESLKNNKDYTKNFAPNNFSQKILNSCMHDMLDAARSEYAFLPPLKTDEKLDSTAMMHLLHRTGHSGDISHKGIAILVGQLIQVIDMILIGYKATATISLFLKQECARY